MTTIVAGLNKCRSTCIATQSLWSRNWNDLPRGASVYFSPVRKSPFSHSSGVLHIFIYRNDNSIDARLGDDLSLWPTECREVAELLVSATRIDVGILLSVVDHHI